jgi:hypothetical protein
MASIALSVIRCIDYLAYGTIFTRAMFLPKKKGDVFFPARKAADEANSYNAHFFSPFFFFIADSSFFLFAFFLGPYSERNFF